MMRSWSRLRETWSVPAALEGSGSTIASAGLPEPTGAAGTDLRHRTVVCVPRDQDGSRNVLLGPFGSIQLKLNDSSCFQEVLFTCADHQPSVSLQTA